MPEEAQQEPSYKEKRIRSITRIYYSRPDVQKALTAFAAFREVIPRYFESFGKRPDVVQYVSDINALVQKGATSFHASEELWRDPLQIGVEGSNQIDDLRIGWDLLIDIDSPYLDYSKIAAQLVCETLEKQGIQSYGVKFSGSKGFHIIVPYNAFPKEVEGYSTASLFPELARAITEFILASIKDVYNRTIAQSGLNFEAIEQRTKLSKEDLLEIKCPNCKSPAEKQTLSLYTCTVCRTTLQRKNAPSHKKALQCNDPRCPGTFELQEVKEYHFCKNCNLSSLEWQENARHKVVSERTMPSAAQFQEELSGDKLGSLDLVLVSPRHLFRMPYSLHEKTGLASVVILPSQLASFSPKDADPMKVLVKEFYPIPRENEAARLVQAALAWKRAKKANEPLQKKPEYSKEFTETELKNVPEELYPAPIQKLLQGLTDGRKRGLFVLLTFLRCVGKTPEEVTKMTMGWNAKNNPPLKEGYVKSQLDWHFKQKKKILPPNYENTSFYKDLNLLKETPTVKNPLVEVTRAMKKSPR